MKEVSRKQGFQLMSVLANNADWSRVPSDVAQRIINDPMGSGQEFTSFLINGGRVVSVNPNVISITRTIPFSPAQFLGEGWSIWKGPADGDGLSGEEDQDERSLALTEVDLSKVRLLTCLKKGGNSIGGEEKLKRLKKDGHICLDAQIFLALWKNQHLIPERWKEKTNGDTTYIFFDGTVLRSPFGNRSVPFLYWHGGRWLWLCFWLEIVFYYYNPSAVLAS